MRDDEVDDIIVHAFAQLEVGEDEGAGAAHPARVAVHDFEAGADQRGEVDFVDDEEIRAGDVGAALAGDLVTGGDIDDIDRQICQLGREGRGEVVAARLDQDQIELREQPVHLGDGGEINRGVLADRGMRTAAGLDTADPFGRQRAAAAQTLRILPGIDVIGDRGDLVVPAHALAQPVYQRSLARPYWTSDAYPQRVAIRLLTHDRKSLVYCVSCAI